MIRSAGAVFVFVLSVSLLPAAVAVAVDGVVVVVGDAVSVAVGW